MMKKFLAAILLLLYVSVSAASALQLHYCEGQWMTNTGSSILVKNMDSKEGCHSCQEQKNRDCCNHPLIQFKLNPDQFAGDKLSLKVPAVSKTFVITAFHFLQSAFEDVHTVSSSFTYTPPDEGLTSSNRRLSFYCSFLI